MQKVSQSIIYKQYLGTRPLLRVYKGEEIIQNYEQDYTQPVDWFDIRTDCPKNSIALYVAHPEDYSSYDNLGFTSNCSGGYKVYIDGIQYGTTYSSGSTCSITWSSANITTGRPILTPTKLIAHKIWIVPATIGNNITAFHCARVAASGTEAQGVLWVHFNLTNEISILDCFYTASTLENRILTACTAKNNKISPSDGMANCFYNCNSLEYVPVFIAPNRYRNFYGAFRYCYKLKELTIKNLKASNVNNFFTDARSLEKLNLPNADFSSATTMANFLTNAANLKDTTLDARTGILFTRLACHGSSSYFMDGLKGLRVSNEAPFNDATAPQINVSYTGMDRAALVQLFNDLPYNIGYEVVGNPTINNGIVSNIDVTNYVYLSSVYINNSAIKIKAKLKITRAPGDYTDIYFGNNSYFFFATSWGSAIVRFRANTSDDWNTISIPLSSFPMQEDTYYWFEYSYDGIDTHTLKLSSDGETWVSNSLTLEGGLPTSIATFRLTTERTLETDLNNNSISLNDIPYFTGKAAMTKSIDCSYCTGTSALTNEDKAIVSNKNWSLTAAVPATGRIMFDVPQGSTVTVNGTDYTPIWTNEVWHVDVILTVGSTYTYTISKPGYLSTSGSAVCTGDTRSFFISAIGTGATVDFNNSGYSKIIVPWSTEVSYTASENGYISCTGTKALTNFTEEELHFAKLIVNIDPTPDTVTINGSSGDKLLFLDGTTFNYTVVANKSGYQTLTLTGSIDTDATITGTIEKAPLFESSTPGTYSLILSEPVNCFVAVVGGGSGGGAELFSGNKGGGSGAAVYGNTTLPAGTYTIYVGDGSPKHRDSIAAAGASSIQENNSAYMITASGAQSHWSITAGLRGDLVYASDINLTILQGNDANDMTGGASVYEGYGKGGSYNEDGGNGYVLIRSL